jgi:hypothetical protein
VGFGTCLYLLRAHFQRLAEPGRLAPFLGLVVIVGLLFWLGARADSEVDQLDEEIRALDEVSRSRAKPESDGERDRHL